MRKLTLVVCILAGTIWADSGSDLFQKALVAERANGKLEDAIKLYQRIAQQYAEDRSLAAKALIQMGQCYEKLGDPQARKVYDRVVRDYADQHFLAAAARTGLGRLGLAPQTAAPDRTKLRHVQVADGLDDVGRVSPDGQFLSFVDGGHGMGELTILDLATGEKRQVTHGASHDSKRKEGAETSAFSPDGKQLAYGWHTPSDSDQLRVINIDGTGERILYQSDRPVWFQTQEWAGGNILVWCGERDSDNIKILVISAADGSARTLGWFRGGGLRGVGVRISPDGQWVAGSHPVSKTVDELNLTPIDGGHGIQLLKPNGHARVAAWTPDGRALFLTAMNEGHNNLYALHIDNGQAAGEPVLIRRDVPADITVVGNTRQGSLYYEAWGTSSYNIYTSPIDPDTGRIQARPVLATTLAIGENSYSSWSPDGTKMAYYTGKHVAIMDLGSGAVHEIAPPLASFNKLQWRPDQKAIMTYAKTPDGKQGIFSIDPQTAEVTPLALSEPGMALHNPVWTTDGKSFLYRKSDGRGNGVIGGTTPVSILIRNLESGRTQELFSTLSPRPSTLAVSPDGKEVAFLIGKSIMAVPIAGGAPRTILQLKGRESFQSVGGLVWMPNGKRLLFLKQISDSIYASSDTAVTVWSVPAGGGEAESTGVTMNGIGELSVSPDGRRIGFDAETPSGKPEIWVLEGFAGLL